MIQRCTNPQHPEHHRYGGRGISVCDGWLDFSAFYADMGDRPQGLLLDRYPDRDGNYEKLNCRWATTQQSTINTDRVQLAIGVRRTRNGKYSAEIIRSYIRHYLGTFESFEEAADARRAAKERLDG